MCMAEDSVEIQQRFAVGDLTVDAGMHRVAIDRREIKLPKLSFQLLMALVHAAPDMLTTDRIIEIVWSGRVVSNETVTQRVKLLRQAIGDDATSPKYIGVVRGEGYRLLVGVRPLPREPTSDLAGAPSRRGVMVGLGMGLLLVVALAWWWVMSGGAGVFSSRDPAPRLAVLPFLNLSTDADNDPFVDGLTEEIISELSRSPELRVAGRTSSFAFKNRNPSFAELGDALNVDEVLEGSVRWDANSLRITVQLISAADGFHLWSETYVRELDDVFSVQRDIARDVSNALQVELGVSSASKTGTTNGRAYAHFLRGQALFWNHTREMNERAIGEYLEALKLDSGFVRAWIGLGYAYGARSREVGRTAAALDEMERAAQRASELAPDFWEVAALIAWVQMSRHSFLDAERSMAVAIEMRARDGPITEHINCPVACYFQQIGRVSDALAEALVMQRSDPLSPSASDAWTWLYLLGRRDEAIDAFRQAEAVGATPFSKRQFQQWFAMENPDPAAMNEELIGTPLTGKWGDPEQLLPLLEPAANPQIPLRRGVRATFAMFAAIHGDDALALRLLRADFLPPGFGAYYLMWHPALRRVRASDGFAQFVTELGLVEAWRKTGNWGDFCSQTPEGRVSCR